MTIPELQDALQRSIEQGVDKIEIDRIQAELDRRMSKKPLRIEVHPEVKGLPTVIPQEKQRNAFDSAVYEANKRIAATDAETKSIGLNSEARDRAKMVAELEEAAKRSNTQAGFQNAAVTDQQREKINQLADAMDAAAKRQREAQEQFKALNDVLKLSGDIAVDFIDKLGDRTAKWRAMLTSTIEMLKKAAIQAAILGTGPLAGMLGTASTVPGAAGGFMGALAKLFGGARAGGGDVDAGKAYLIGERGPEIMVPKAAGSIIPHHQIGRRGGINQVIHNHVANVTVNAAGGRPEDNQDLAEKVGRSVQDSLRTMMIGEVRQQMRPGGLLSQ